MKNKLRWLIWIAFCALLIAFLFANRQPVALSLDPFSAQTPVVATPSAPLWLWLIFALLIGLGLGAAAMWLSGREMRIRAKADRLELMALKKPAPAPPVAKPTIVKEPVPPPAFPVN